MARTATARRPAHVALFEATTLTAKGVKEHLAARSFPIASMKMFASRQDPESNLTEFRGEAMLITEPDVDALGPLDIAFLCGSREDAAPYLDWPGRRGFVAIDLTGGPLPGAVPLVNAAVNADAIPEGPGLIATPHPIAQLLSTLLAPVVRGPGLVEASAVVLQPASEAGEKGIEELYRQAVGLLNFQDVPRDIFKRQLAFNLIPASLYAEDGTPGNVRPEALSGEVLRITGGEYVLSVQAILVPVFHCHAVLAHLRLPRGAGRDQLLSSFEGVGEVAIGDSPLTPIDKAGQEGVTLAEVRSGEEGSSFWLWAVADNLKGGTALNAVRIAEGVLDRPPARGRA
jgi:aspartate-semialdehyde dehydrogenase